MSSVDLKLVDKIQKLLALATSPNENEARLAAEKANELLIRHNLSMDDLAADVDIAIKYKQDVAYESKQMAFEVRWVASIINTHFFVSVIQQQARVRVFGRTLKNPTPARLYFVGKPTNIAVAKYTFEFLSRKYKELWKQYQKETGAHNHLKGVYYDGLTRGLHEQLKRVLKKVESDTALVVRKDPNLEKAVGHYIGATVKISGPGIMAFDRDVQRDGYKEGKNLQIHRGLEQKDGSKGFALEDKSKK